MKIVWDQVGEHLYETGVKNAVLFPYDATASTYANGVAWNGITGVTESPSGAEATALYADNIKYLNLYSAEEFGATVTAYTYPDAFARLDGSANIAEGISIGQQTRGTFALVYRTEQGSDVDENYGYKIHIIYGAKASPSERAFSTINDSPEAIEFSWELNTTPVAVSGFKPTATVVIDSTKVDPTKLQALEDYIYGTDGTFSYQQKTGLTNGDSVVGLYERSGTAGSYVYTLTTDTVYSTSDNKTYYEKVETGGTAATLPLPDKIVELVG